MQTANVNKSPFVFKYVGFANAHFLTNNTYKINGNINSIDLASVTYDGSENLLPAGKYYAEIRVLASDKINSFFIAPKY